MTEPKTASALIDRSVVLEVLARYRRPCGCLASDLYERDGRFRCGTCDALLIRKQRTT